MNMMLLNVVIVYIPMILIGLVMPLFSKKTLFFGVNIPEDRYDSNSIKILKKSYYINYSLSSISSTAVLAYFYSRTNDERVLIAGTFVYIILLSANYYYIHRKTKILKNNEGWLVDKKQVIVVDTKKRPNEKAISPWWFLIPLSIIIFGLLFTMIQYPYLPDKLPGHFNAAGEVTRYDNKSLYSAFMLPLVQLGMTAMMFGLYKVMSSAKITINPARPKTTLLQGQLANRRWGIFTVLMATLLNAQFLYLQFMVLQLIGSSKSMLISLVIYSGIIGLVIYTSITTGQGGSRIKVSVEETQKDNTKLIQRDDDIHWKLGMLYYNPADPTLWVEKRFGIGWTINHAHPIGKILTVIMVVVLFGTLIFSMMRL